jgi:hypothetical protein
VRHLTPRQDDLRAVALGSIAIYLANICRGLFQALELQFILNAVKDCGKKTAVRGARPFAVQFPRDGDFAVLQAGTLPRVALNCLRWVTLLK